MLYRTLRLRSFVAIGEEFATTTVETYRWNDVVIVDEAVGLCHHQQKPIVETILGCLVIVGRRWCDDGWVV